MSLYRYVASKDDLLLLVLDAAIGPPPDGADQDWREQCTGWARALRADYARHPWMLELPISALPAGPNQLAWFDRGLAALAGTTLAEREKASSVLLLATYVRTQTQLMTDLMRAAQSGQALEWGSFMERLADPARFPAVARAVAAGTFAPDPERAEQYPDDEFDFGLQRILDGIEALHRSRVSG
jgi:AcrR family transcriptional regulator